MNNSAEKDNDADSLEETRKAYKGVRKKVPPPTKVERDERRKLERKRAEREMREHEGKREPDSEESIEKDDT